MVSGSGCLPLGVASLRDDSSRFLKFFMFLQHHLMWLIQWRTLNWRSKFGRGNRRSGSGRSRGQLFRESRWRIRVGTRIWDHLLNSAPVDDVFFVGFACYPLVNVYKRLHSYGKSPSFFSVNQLFLWAIFNSYVTNYQRDPEGNSHYIPYKSPIN